MNLPIIFTASLLIIASFFNLFGLVTKRYKLAGVFKVFLVPLIILLCYLINPQMNFLIYLGLLFGWLGDLFLLSDKSHMFLLGLSSFLVGHVMYMLAMAGELALYNIPVIIIVSAVLLTLIILIYNSLKNHVQKEMKPPLIAYLLCLVGITFFSVNIFFSSMSVHSTALLCGSTLFFISDYVLARGVFIKKTPLIDFIIMSTYISAQVLISSYFLFN